MSKELEALNYVWYHYYTEELDQDEVDEIEKNLNVVQDGLKRLESIDNAEPSEALECLEYIENKLRGLRVECERIKNHRCDDVFIQEHTFDTIKQALLKAQEPKQYVDELKLVEKKLKALDLLMQELDCKDFADLRKYARCGYEKLNKKYLKWEDLEKFEEQKDFFALLNGNKYTLCRYRDSRNKYVMVNLNEINIATLCDMFKQDIDFFNDLHLEMVEEC